jgi:hypothetical protein
MIFLLLLAAFVLVIIDLAFTRGRSLTAWAVLILIVLRFLVGSAVTLPR